MHELNIRPLGVNVFAPRPAYATTLKVGLGWEEGWPFSPRLVRRFTLGDHDGLTAIRAFVGADLATVPTEHARILLGASRDDVFRAALENNGEGWASDEAEPYSRYSFTRHALALGLSIPRLLLWLASLDRQNGEATLWIDVIPTNGVVNFHAWSPTGVGNPSRAFVVASDGKEQL